MLINLSRLDEARRALALAEELSSQPNTLEGRVYMAMLRMAQADCDEAENEFAKALALRQEAQSLIGKDEQLQMLGMPNRLRVSYLQQRLGQFDDATATVQAVVDMMPPNSVDSTLFSHYMACRLADQEAYAASVALSEAALEQLQAVKSTPGVDATQLRKPFTAVLMAALDEMAYAGDEDAAAKAITLRNTMQQSNELQAPMLSK